MDPLGTGCIDGGGYDDPFPSSKGVRAPAFCLPHPCDEALTRTELGRDILGREVADWEWDTYYSRYAEFCRAEAVVPRGDAAPSGNAVADFWAPILAPPVLAYLPAGPGRSGIAPSAGSGGGGIPFIPTIPIGGGPPPDTGDGTSPGGGGSPNPGGDGGPNPGGGGSPNPGGGGGTNPGGDGGIPPVVPLPMTAWLLLSGLLALTGLRRRSRTA
ncbi:hypothetical protein ACOI1H_14390 [Loktanella sp. DJP18]|uniref:hypothetical protein n=1 Tax=Loktanella sp. DJP18 TaxID=3409788 RepID=UPI003BB5ECA7